ncbi:MAG: hypothetical protein KAJ23_06685 [Maribacter sp.]|nr:hypothetical protein [Maribacter sp.]
MQNLYMTIKNSLLFNTFMLDDLVESNPIYNIAKSPLRFHKTYTNPVKDNYFFSNGEIPGIAYIRTQPNAIKKREIISSALIVEPTIRYCNPLDSNFVDSNKSKNNYHENMFINSSSIFPSFCLPSRY